MRHTSFERCWKKVSVCASARCHARRLKTRDPLSTPLPPVFRPDMYTQPTPRYRVALVDPHPSDYQQLYSRGADVGHQFVTLSTFADATEFSSWDKIDCVLIATRLPDGCGFELHQRLDKSLRGKVVCFVAPEHSDVAELQTHFHHAQGYLIKPITSGRVLQWEAAVNRTTG